MNSFERRKSARTFVEKLGYINFEPQNIGGVIEDLSTEGLRFHIVVPAQCTGPVNVSLLLGSGEQIPATAEVVWMDISRRIGGLRFTSLADEARDTIRRWGDRFPARAPATQSPVVAVVGGPNSPRQAERSVGTPQPSNWPVPDWAPTPMPYIGHFDPDPAPEGSAFRRGVIGGVVVSAMLVGFAWFVFHHRSGAALHSNTSPVATNVATEPPAPLDLNSYAVPPATASLQSLTALLPARNDSAALATAAAPVNSKLSQPVATASVPKPLPNPSVSLMAKADSVDTGEGEVALARQYLNGIGQPRDGAVASRLLWAAVEKGNPTAEIALADLYVRGEGVTKNCDQARVLLLAASNRGDAQAVERLRALRVQGCP